MAQATWSSPASNRLLLEASLGLGPDLQFGGLQKNSYDKTLIRVTDQAARFRTWRIERRSGRVREDSLASRRDRCRM